MESNQSSLGKLLSCFQGGSFYSDTSFCLFDLILYVSVNNFPDMSGRVFLGCSSAKATDKLKCLAQELTSFFTFVTVCLMILGIVFTSLCRSM